MAFSRQEYWSGLLCPPPEIFLTWMGPRLLHLLHWQAGSLPLAPPRGRDGRRVLYSSHPDGRQMRHHLKQQLLAFRKVSMGSLRVGHDWTTSLSLSRSLHSGLASFSPLVLPPPLHHSAWVQASVLFSRTFPTAAWWAPGHECCPPTPLSAPSTAHWQEPHKGSWQ